MSINSALKKLILIESDLIQGCRELSGQESRFLVDAYYQQQEFRKAASNQVRSVEESDEPHAFIESVVKHSAAIEELIRSALEGYVLNYPAGRWMMGQRGIGPVIAANMLAYLDITKARTCGAFWRFAGLDPSVEWKKGQKRPFNAALKVACWKASDSWVKQGEHQDAFYAQLYRRRKEQEVERNEAGLFADQAAAKLERFNIGKSTDAYKAYAAGKLPPAHLDARARRYAVKMFLAHLHWVMWEDHYGTPAPRPYSVEHQGHVHVIPPPGWAAIEGEPRAAM